MQVVKYEKNMKEGRAFLNDNKTAPGVVTLPSGLQYKAVKTGSGAKPTIADKVTVHYHGTLIDGTVFDSSVERKQPIELTVNQVIPGWIEALQLMPVGSKWILYIPSELAYGENPRPGGPIEPNSALIFEVELLSINN
jgi:FKBP-type peptidyl-prolyl cis-trans isomerase FklB